MKIVFGIYQVMEMKIFEYSKQFQFKERERKLQGEILELQKLLID